MVAPEDSQRPPHRAPGSARLPMSPMKPMVEDDVQMPPPKNVGQLPNPDIVGIGGSPSCGDHVYLYFKMDPKTPGHRVQEASHVTVGCGYTLAAGSFVTEWVKGRPIDDLRALDEATVRRLAGVSRWPDRKIHCIELVLDAARDAAAKAAGSA